MFNEVRDLTKCHTQLNRINIIYHAARCFELIITQHQTGPCPSKTQTSMWGGGGLPLFKSRTRGVWGLKVGQRGGYKGRTWGWD